eukprot:gene34289-biopygen5708
MASSLSHLSEISTGCCKSLSLSVQTPFVSSLVSGSVSDVARVSWDWLPSSPLTVSVSGSLSNSSSGLGLGSALTFFPSWFVLDSSESSPWVSLSLVVPEGSGLQAGDYSLSLSLSGQSSAEYSVSSIASVSLKVLGSGEPIPAPVLVWSEFVGDGRSVVVSFDSPSDRGGRSLGSKFSSTVSVSVNAGPDSGLFSLNPSQGRELVDVFKFQASGWEDPEGDLPLSYQFGFRSVS